MTQEELNDTYHSLRELVRAIYLSAKGDRGFNPYQAFSYAYDETEGMFGRGNFQHLCLLVALFICVEIDNLSLSREDPFTQDVINELRAHITNFENGRNSNSLDPRYMDEDLVRDISILKSKY